MSLLRVTTLLCPLCSALLQSPRKPPDFQPHYDTCHPGVMAPRV